MLKLALFMPLHRAWIHHMPPAAERHMQSPTVQERFALRVSSVAIRHGNRQPALPQVSVVAHGPECGLSRTDDLTMT